MKDKKGFILYRDLLSSVNYLSDEDLGKFFRAILNFQNQKPIEIPDNLKIGFEFLKTQFERDEKSYKEVIHSKSLAGKASAEARRMKKEAEANSTHVETVQQNQQSSTSSTNPTDRDRVSDSVSDSFRINFTSASNNLFLSLSSEAKKERILEFWKERKFKSDSEKYFLFREKENWKSVANFEADAAWWENGYLEKNKPSEEFKKPIVTKISPELEEKFSQIKTAIGPEFFSDCLFFKKHSLKKCGNNFTIEVDNDKALRHTEVLEKISVLILKKGASNA